MPSLLTPPNPAPTELPPDSPDAPKLAAGRFGALDHSEIVHLLSSLDDEVARARFRESIYISLFICLALAWFAFYGPRVLFHQGRLIVPGESQRNKNEMAYLDMPKDLIKRVPPKSTKVISDQDHVAQTAHPTPKPPTPQELQAMRKAGAPGASTPRPLPPTPQPQPAQPQPQPQPRPQQAQPQPQPQPQHPPQQASNIPDAPRPSQTPGRPNFSTPSSPGQSISQAAREAAERGQGGENGLNAPRAHAGTNTGVEVLSDTLGTDFGPYIRRLLRTTQAAWEPLIPEECYPPLSKTGMTLIRFTILPDGTIAPGSMHLDDSTRDVAIDKAAWGSLTSQGKFPPLPSTFKGPNLELRIQFNIVRGGSEAR